MKNSSTKKKSVVSTKKKVKSTTSSSRNTTSKKVIKQEKKEKTSEIVPTILTPNQQYWPWSYAANNATLPTILKIKDYQQKIDIEITGSKSIASQEKTKAFYAVFSEPYEYYLQWTPIIIPEKSTSIEHIIGMCSNTFIIQRHLSTIMEWNETLRRFSRLNSIEIHNALDIDIMKACLQLIVYDPQLIQAVDAIVEKLKKKENKMFLDTLLPPEILMGFEEMPPEF